MEHVRSKDQSVSNNSTPNVKYAWNSLVVHCKSLGTFCPYFSIEFKVTIDDTRIVVNQVAGGGSISLFNGYQLKLDPILNLLPSSWNSSVITD